MVERDSGSDDGDGVQTITELVKAQMDVTGRSYRDLEAESERSGHRVKFQTFQELGTVGPKSWPKSVDTIRGLARALGVTEQAIVLAFAKSLGVRLQRSSALAQQLPAEADDLGPEMRTAILRVIRAAAQEREHRGDTTPMTERHPGEVTAPADPGVQVGPDELAHRRRSLKADQIAADEIPSAARPQEQWDRDDE